MVMAPQPPREFTIEELEPLEHWFESCNGAQQATIAVKLLSRADPKAAHLIHSFLQQRLLVANAIWRQEIQRANDPAFLNGLRNESRDVAVSQLLHYLPLLRPANSDGVRGYIHLLPGLLASFLEDDPNQGPSTHVQSTEIQQLLTYALIHPALSLESKRSLAELIRQLDDEGNQEMALSLLESNHQGGLDMFPPSDPQSPDTFQTAGIRHSQWDLWNSPSAGLGPPKQPPHPPPPSISQRIRRSNSLTPPSNSMAYPQDPWATNQNDNGRNKPRSLSLSSPSETGTTLSHCPLSPQNSLASSGSGSGSDSIYSDDSHRPSSFHIPGSGMRDVPAWLKSLRLHKYAHLFSLLTYEEMLALTEEQLELQGVTKGARHKIALSILRLRERPTLLAQLEKEVVDSGSLHNALSELKNLLTTPIKPYRGPPAEDQLYINNLSPSPSPLRDDTSGYSSLDGSMDNLTSSRAPSSPMLMNESDAPTLSKNPLTTMTTPSVVRPDMCPTVIVSAAPDVDSAEEGSDTSADDGLGDNFRSAFASELELQTHLSHDDLPGQITRLLGKICTQLLVTSAPAEENVSQFVGLLDRCLSHEAFTQRQRRRIASWKEQAHRIWNNLPPSAGRNNSANNNGQQQQQKGSEGGGRFARRWSNVAHYPGFYNGADGSSAAQSSFTCAPPNAYSLFPSPRQQQQQQRLHPSPCPSPSQIRPLFASQSPTHNSYGQHTHTGLNRSGMATPHSLQVGSHLPIQHRNSFCVSTLPYQNYSSLSTPDPFTFSSHRFDELPSETSFASRLGIQRARSAPMANGVVNNPSLFSHDVSEMDLNHRLESLCLSMTEHALEGANDI